MTAQLESGETRAPDVGLRERKRAEARARTADAALALIAERGYDAVTVADICRAADIAPRSFFRYFPTKEDVLVEPVRRLNERLEAAIAAAPADLDDGAALRLAMLELGEHVLEQGERLTAFFDVIARTASLRSSPLLHLGERERAVADQLLRRRGVATPADWRTRLLVASIVAGFRIWFDQLRADALDDPSARLQEILAAAAGDPRGSRL